MNHSIDYLMLVYIFTNLKYILHKLKSVEHSQKSTLIYKLLNTLNLTAY